MQELISFQTYSTAEEAAEKLQKEHIPTEIVKAPILLDAVIIGKEYANDYTLKIPANDFTQANSLLYTDVGIDIAQIDVHPPLYDMANDELQDIVAKPDEWGQENYNIALALLKSRGIAISDATVLQLQQERVQTLSAKKSFSKIAIFLGYLAAAAPVIINVERLNTEAPVTKITSPLWFFPGLAGFAISLIILTTKTTLPDGKRLLTYNALAIKQGKWIFACNVLSWIINILLLIFLL